MLEAGTALSAFFVGLLGATHCVAMCGGIVGALTLGLPGEDTAQPQRLWPYLIAYNAGRIASYTLAGVLVGVLGAQLASVFTPAHAHTYGHAFSAVFLIVLGLYLAGWWRGLVVLERGGAHLWRRIEPLGRRLLPVRNPLHAAALGLLWGWLPCGLVYSALAWAFAGADPNRRHGDVAFGLGTLPMLLTMGAAAIGSRPRRATLGYASRRRGDHPVRRLQPGHAAAQRTCPPRQAHRPTNTACSHGPGTATWRLCPGSSLRGSGGRG